MGFPFKDYMIFSHLSPEYEKLHLPHDNGAYWYSKDLVERIVPHIKTDRDWVLINVKNQCVDRAIVFIHECRDFDYYDWLKPYKDLILVCSHPIVVEALIKKFPKFHIIYLPLSIDVDFVKQFKVKRKTKNKCFFGRLSKCPSDLLKDETIDKLYGEREALLKEVAKYKTVYANGRCAVEAKALGCKIINPYNEIREVNVIDNKQAITELQRLINEIDMKGESNNDAS